MGHNEFVSRGAARVNVAGDSDDPTGPTYETMGTLTSVSYPGAEGLAISGTIDRDGVVEGTPPATVDMLRAHGVTFGPYSAETDKYTASVFWDFANSQGPVYQNGAVQTDQLFDPWFYATGLPVTDAWWANVKIANTYKWVLVQCFERRCLTYTPDNPAGWQVEAGNIDQHYYTGRYEQAEEPDPNAIPDRGALIDTFNNHIDDYEDVVGDGWMAFTVSDELHHIEESDDGVVDLYTSDLYMDLIVTVEARFVTENVDALACVSVRGEHQVSSYSLCLWGDGAVDAAYTDAGGDEYVFESLLDLGCYPSVKPTDQWNTLEIIAKGDRLWFLVNGELLGTATHDALSSGPVTVFTSRNLDANPVEVAYRNLYYFEVK